MDESELQPAEELSPAVEGLLACIETGLAHLTPEERRDWETGADPNVFLPRR